jgi:pyrroloquinoline-quinone synthase
MCPGVPGKSHNYRSYSVQIPGMKIPGLELAAVIQSPVYWNVFGGDMESKQFFEVLDARITKYDLLCHPFYQAWAAGQLTREDLQEYARNYYHHVEAFPRYLAELAIRLDESELRKAILANMAEEKGVDSKPGRAHSELWLDFAEGMGARRNMRTHKPLPEINELIAFFHRLASEGTPEEALAAFYAYESQVPRIAKEKARGLREMYGADERATAYFTLHTTADVFHAHVWQQQLAKRLVSDPGAAERALAAGESAARALWKALDGIEAQRTAKAAA